jgi:choline dehydrogenase
MIGSHPMAVVDDGSRVHGLEGLRVIDASVMPAATSTDTKRADDHDRREGSAIIKAAAPERLAA